MAPLPIPLHQSGQYVGAIRLGRTGPGIHEPLYFLQGFFVISLNLASN
ncbi:hypothetical protein SAMN05661077_1171 [Thiohalorhabdus denitrificans]|uniref:Uncharacterized protein n=1 Tax=Thiohalorhabdus denitrificans TaxID=381306 RepID=A0A1G5D4D4_9GAMM|nr:hypothetical protein SAMN05661077_1171 [Thiohalorhabdus denitrificans]